MILVLVVVQVLYNTIMFIPLLLSLLLLRQPGVRGDRQVVRAFFFQTRCFAKVITLLIVCIV